ncbi:hypothetical protein, partial [Salmonella enterica]|uniref:hypothetical protein n=1 Tax=Salmonella enterica TaxID=28901 RepID=UPI001BAFD00A
IKRKLAIFQVDTGHSEHKIFLNIRQEASPRYRSLPHAACSSLPVTGQRRPWNNEPTILIVGELMPRKRLEGRP